MNPAPGVPTSSSRFGLAEILLVLAVIAILAGFSCPALPAHTLQGGSAAGVISSAGAAPAAAPANIAFSRAAAGLPGRSLR